MPPQNRAAWLMNKQDPVFIVKEAPYTAPEPNEIVIKTAAVAINPADIICQKLGIIIPHYPAILGCDAAGTIIALGSSIPPSFKIGDRVLGNARPDKPLLPSGIYKYSAFQQYVVLKLPLIAKIPESATFEDAVVLPLGLLASSACLFHSSTLGLAMPPREQESGSGSGRGEVLLVWGASSSVGCCGVQLAIAAGYEVFGVASARNHQMVRSVGASKVFDQADKDLVEQVVDALKGKQCVGAFDAISKPETLGPLCDILDGAGGRKLVAAIAPGAEGHAKKGVTIRTNFGARDFEETVGPKIFGGFLERALEEGSFRYLPVAEVVGRGLEDIQKACDILAQGVSAKKVVVSL
ncbi:oxidoreductase [Mollisia scopiformis]|uniref:Oxidoreductase n=1 Tax=Mollisia scopiformis TaxID=149040 RepID=A0A194XNE5_MOLSC|nr:oxidoreductase [Mollisia scopiformis]KUJ21629.1 oxidoreductase [Mollisia scopiformis]